MLELFTIWVNLLVLRGTIALCVLPPQDYEPLRSVKWHPQQPDLVAVASDTNIYFINIADAVHMFGGEPIPQTELHRVGQIFSVPSVSTFAVIVRVNEIYTFLAAYHRL